MESAKKKIWQYLPYAGIPAVVIALFVSQLGRADAFSLLNKELMIILGYVAAILDLKDKRIPNKLILIMITAWILLMIPKLFLDTDLALSLLKDSLLGFAIGGGLFLFVYLISHKGLGGGDVKFMAGAGLFLGFGGIIPAMLYGSILAALTALALIILKRITRKDTIPLVPFLYLGTLITTFFQ